MRRETAIIFVLLALVLFPMWGIAIAAGNVNAPIPVNEPAKSTLAPTASLINSSTEFSVFSAGILSFLAVGVIVALIGIQTKFVDRLARITDPITGEAASSLVPPFVRADYRRVLAYWPATENQTGFLLLGVFSFLAVMFAVLFGNEALTQSSVQILGLYSALMFFSLAATATLYATYFTPSMIVGEQRKH